MSKFKPKQGDMVEVRDTVDAKWTTRQFAITHEGFHYCAVDKYGMAPWRYIRPIPTKPEPIPFTHETWPKQVVWIRKGIDDCRMVNGHYKDGIIFNGRYHNFERLMENEWEVSLDFCETWKPCHCVQEG